MAKVSVEQYLDKEDITQQESVRQALSLLVWTRDDLRDFRHDLIVTGYREKWTPEQQKYFNDAWDTIKTVKFDYFLSFTCRDPNPAAMGDNPVNSAYKYFIRSIITNREFDRADRKTRNLLAEAVNKLLSQPPLGGFYFPYWQFDNTETVNKLQDGCDHCLVFVQLVQTIMFQPPLGGGTNYSFFEWQRVNPRFPGDDNERHMLFVIAAPDRRNFLQVPPHANYLAWHQQIQTKDPPYLQESKYYNQPIIKETEEVFINKIVRQIRSAWHRLIDGVPA